MLAIQKFIYEHENWYELLSAAPYNLKISEKNGFYLFKYSQIDSDFNEEIVCEARGLILDSLDNFRVVRMAFKKFFNIGESFAAKIDWNTARVTEKIDGSIMTLWYARNEWHLSTNNTIDAFDAEISNIASPYKTFGELFYATFNCDLNVLDQTSMYTFELVSPYTQIVLQYDEPKLYLLSMRDCSSLMEVRWDLTILFAKFMKVEIPEQYYLHSKDDIIRLVENMDETHEGVVVVDDFGERVKIKTESYFRLHKLWNNGQMSLKEIIKLILDNDHEEFLSYFPSSRPYFNKIAAKLEDIKHIIMQADVFVHDWRNYNGDKKKKEFAERVKKLKYTPLYFLEYDRKLPNGIYDLPINKIISWFDLKEVE